jgi:hypothetical protein
LEDVYYFTAIYHKDKKWVRNHKDFINACHSIGVKVIHWKYQDSPKKFDKWANKVISATYVQIEEINPQIISTLPIPRKMTFLKPEEKRKEQM